MRGEGWRLEGGRDRKRGERVGKEDRKRKRIRRKGKGETEQINKDEFSEEGIRREKRMKKEIKGRRTLIHSTNIYWSCYSVLGNKMGAKDIRVTIYALFLQAFTLVGNGRGGKTKEDKESKERK